MLDFQGLAAQLLQSSEAYLSQWLPAGKRRGNEYLCGDLYGSEGESLSINIATGKWADFATGDKGGDLISLYAAIHGIQPSEAYKQLGGGEQLQPPRHESKKPEKKKRTVLSPIPIDAPELPDMRHYQFGEPTKYWTYQNQDFQVLGYVARYDPPEGRKQFIPWTYSSEKGWGMGQWDEPRPIYGLDHLEAYPDRPVLICEGEKACDAAREFATNYTVISWPGGAQAVRKVDWSPLKKKKVLIWPDADEAGKNAAKVIGALINEKASAVKVLNVDDMPDGWDAADSGFTEPEFKKWAKQRAHDWQPPELPQLPATAIAVQSAEQQPRFNDEPQAIYVVFASMPMRTAELFKATRPSGGRIIYWRGQFYAWRGFKYAAVDEVAIEQQLYSFLSMCKTWKAKDDDTLIAFHPKKSHIADVMHALRAVSYADLPEPQCWIDEHDGDPHPGQILAFKNGFLNLSTRELTPATDRLFVISALDFDYNPEAATPWTWLEFLAEIWNCDTQSQNCLSEVFGYLLTDRTEQQKMFMFIGPPRSGKGTILRILESLIGPSNRVSPSLAGIGTNFGLEPLIGKRLALISDARLSGKSDQQPIVENLLRISGEDAVTIDRKRISMWSGTLSTRFVFAANELPQFSDSSAALANRFVLFKFTKSFLGKEDKSLTHRLLAELPGILLWALDGLDRLTQRGYFTEPESARDLSAQFIEQTSPVRTFAAEMCIIKEDSEVAKDELFKAWREWCKEQGRDHSGTLIGFSRQLHAAFPDISSAHPRGDGGKKIHVFKGIRLRTQWDLD